MQTQFAGTNCRLIVLIHLQANLRGNRPNAALFFDRLF